MTFPITALIGGGERDRWKGIHLPNDVNRRNWGISFQFRLLMRVVIISEESGLCYIKLNNTTNWWTDQETQSCTKEI